MKKLMLIVLGAVLVGALNVSAVAICGAPGMLSGNGVSVERYRIPVYGTNSLFKLIQYTAATNTWPIIIMFQQ